MNETHFDLLLKNGHVIDPANDLNTPLDVGISHGKIQYIAADIPERQADKVIDVTSHYVTPGLLDIHTHVYTFTPTAVGVDPSAPYIGCVDADAHLLASGVTTTVDAGTTGWIDFPNFKTTHIDTATVRVLAFVNIAARGMVDAAGEQNPDTLQPQLVAALADAYPDVIVGIKTAHYWTKQPWDAEHPPWLSVERAVEAGDLCDKPVMVDFWPRPPERPYPDLILEKLRPGDIHTHVFAQQFPIVDEQGKVYDYMFRAQDRGVIFDLGHGAGSFWFRNAVPAWEDGFAPNSISTDLHMGNINGPVESMITTMSKLLNIGMPLADVIRRSTVAPAREINRPDLGTLTPGAFADIAVIRRREGRFSYVDCGRAKIVGSEKLECAMTVKGGKIVYDPTGLSMPLWQDAPEAYWKLPDVQA